MNAEATPMVDQSTSGSLVRFWVGVGAFSGLLCFVGCQTLEEMAPPVVGVGFQIVSERHRVDLSMLELGRQVYVSDCSRCHSLEPIARYSVKRWRTILPRMTRQTRLNAEQTKAVEAYVMAAHTVLAEGLGQAATVGNTNVNGRR